MIESDPEKTNVNRKDVEPTISFRFIRCCLYALVDKSGGENDIMNCKNTQTAIDAEGGRKKSIIPDYLSCRFAAEWRILCRII